MEKEQSATSKIRELIEAKMDDGVSIYDACEQVVTESRRDSKLWVAFTWEFITAGRLADYMRGIIASERHALHHQQNPDREPLPDPPGRMVQPPRRQAVNRPPRILDFKRGLLDAPYVIDGMRIRLAEITLEQIDRLIESYGNRANENLVEKRYLELLKEFLQKRLEGGQVPGDVLSEEDAKRFREQAESEFRD